MTKKTVYIICLAFAVTSCENISKKFEEVTESSGSNADGTTETDFPIAGTWYVNDSGEDYNENALNFSEYTFETPAKVDGKLTGKLNVVSNNDGNPVRSGNYEITGENKLKVSFPNEMDYELTYVYYPEEQKLEINFAGQNRTLTRTNPVVQNNTPQTEEEIKAEAEKIQTQLWMDNIADVKWKEIETTDGITRNLLFDKPVKDNEFIRGILEWEAVSDSQVEVYTYKYEKVSDGQVKCDPIKFTRNGIEEYNDEGVFYLNMKIIDDGKILILENPNYRIWKFTR